MSTPQAPAVPEVGSKWRVKEYPAHRVCVTRSAAGHVEYHAIRPGPVFGYSVTVEQFLSMYEPAPEVAPK